MRRWPLLSVLALLLAACSGPQGSRIKAEDLERIEKADASRSARNEAGVGAAPAAGGSGQQAVAVEAATARPAGEGGRPSAERAKQRDALDDRLLALTRRREDHARALAELESKRERTALEHQSAEASELMAVRHADRERRLAAEDRDHFVDVEQARRLAEDALDLARSQDGLLETREELAQLEMMYSESTLGDATAEIVLSRTRRRLQRAEEGFRLRGERSGELKTITLPREEDRLDQELAGKTLALENSQRARDVGRLAREAALRDLEQEARKQQRDAEDMELEGKRIQEDLGRYERDLAADRAAAAPAPVAPAPPAGSP